MEADKPAEQPRPMTVTMVPVASIKIGKCRYRFRCGDLPGLAYSLSTIGLLSPVGISTDGWLLFGLRRLRAAQILRWVSIAAVIIDVPATDDIRYEFVENFCRKNLDASETTAIHKRIEQYLPQHPKAHFVGAGELSLTSAPAQRYLDPKERRRNEQTKSEARGRSLSRLKSCERKSE